MSGSNTQKEELHQIKKIKDTLILMIHEVETILFKLENPQYSVPVIRIEGIKKIATKDPEATEPFAQYRNGEK